LFQFPSQRVFTATAADNEDFHGNEASLGKHFGASWMRLDRVSPYQS
jgi:hypothetical protein